ncbi:MAG: CAAX geranylgeranyltransferase alpha subunit [Claussenomyces sp. TS43310]|nr:MAG: CAAX geranylgeranyltransferase alpha subunit [Claussenomyces sp. TS43310]
MPPKGKGKKPEPAAAAAAATPPAPEPKTIGEKLQADYLASRPLQVLRDTKGWENLTQAEKLSYSYFRFLESRAYLSWGPQQQKELLASCEKLKIPQPLPKPIPLGKDRKGRNLEDYTIEEYKRWSEEQYEIVYLREKSQAFRSRARYAKSIALREKSRAREGDKELSQKPAPGLTDPSRQDTFRRPVTEEDILEEKLRRVKIAKMDGKNTCGKYEGDPAWDDVTPIPQDDGEQPLAAIAYTDEYAEAISYLRAVMASDEHSQRALDLTAHIITLNAAHYTVWLFRASTLFALHSSLTDELEWVNGIALQNQKNYQIWHHRQLLIDNLYPDLKSDEERLSLAKSELDFIAQMLAQDSKNYHVWSYRQYLVRKLSLFPSQCSDPSELQDLERLIREDVRNNSAWSHRFFVVFSDPAVSTPDSRPTEADAKVPGSVIDGEIGVAQAAIRRAPMNPSPWNYLRGVLRKGARPLAASESFAAEFVRLGDAGGADAEEVRSSHALDFLADCWAQTGRKDEAERALRLLGDKYDRIRKNYWEWRRASLVEVKAEA